MPTLEKKELNLSERKKAGDAAAPEEEGSSKPKKPAAKKAPSKVQTKRLLSDDDDDDEDDDSIEDDNDEVIASSLTAKKKGANKNLMYGVIGIAVVVVVVLLFLIFRGGGDEPEVDPNTIQTDVTPQQPAPEAPAVAPDDPTVGMQDFTKGDNTASDSPMSDPENFTKDIQGLTLRVNFDVDRIYTAADMVTYTKMRGTWGGGLELYWLDVVYKDSKYVIQVPFEYYKELDDSGIIPVKMEVLRIKSDTSDDYLTVVSYMELDVETLKTIQRSQSR